MKNKRLRVWLYSRLSRDEDKEMNSLGNQQKILEEYANNNDYEIVGTSFDDNVSGMHFNREGIEQITNVVENRLIDAVVVKDLSRLGRHRTQTAMFIDYLRENEVKVLSVTENIDTSNEEDELLIGFKGIFNDMYARDISKKIRAGFLQKQKDGIVMIPPLGYFKDKNTDEIVIVEEHAEIIRKIYDLYISGFGIKSIAKMLNEQGYHSPGFYQEKLLGKKLGNNKPEIAHRFLWESTAVKRILQNEFYCGTLICHKSYTNKINKIRKLLPEEESFRHENAVPAIISREIWEQVQFLLENKKQKKVRASSEKPYHRYSGLIKCGNCGSCFICKKRKWKNKPDRYEYVCNGYHRYGKEQCTPHTIGEEVLDELIYGEILELKRVAQESFDNVDKNMRKWIANKPSVEKRINNLKERLKQLEKDQEEILLERIRDRSRAEVYDRMLTNCENEMDNIKRKLSEYSDSENVIKERKRELKKSIELIDSIISDKAISDAHIRMLVEEIIVTEKDGKLKVEFMLNGSHRIHMDYYDENGELVGRDAELWCFPAWS
ncbi:MAG: recombinase [Ruminococcaceae bacterium]|nr:recombinase [Oscillospiraceae bacterium]